jgi:TRAP-type C4-dicarboxylate transport system substrate-binding protein
MKKQLVFLASLLLISPALYAQRGGRSAGETVEIKLASPLPRDSSWGRTLDRLAAEWTRAANNEIRVRVLHNGTEGGEAKMLSSLSSNNIQAALFTSFGLSAICPSIMTLSVPFYIKNDAELSAVLREVQPLLEEQVSRTDYFVITWSKAGWVNVFSRDPVFVPDDLRRQKLATNADSQDLNLVFKTMGFQMVDTDITDVGPKLMSGAVGAIYQNPAAVAAYQMHQTLKNMMSTPIAPAMGGIVINKVTWNRINPRARQEITRISRQIAEEFAATMPLTIANAVTVMGRGGLKVNPLSPAQEELWNHEVQRAIPPLLGHTFDEALYRKIGEVLTRFRNGR